MTEVVTYIYTHMHAYVITIILNTHTNSHMHTYMYNFFLQSSPEPVGYIYMWGAQEEGLGGERLFSTRAIEGVISIT